jgi:CHAD domain-containing protein
MSYASEVVLPALSAQAHATRLALGRVVRDPNDDEAVHDTRVGVRRMRSVLAAGRELFGKKRVDPLVDQLRAAGKATNQLRDEEVLEETLAELELGPEAHVSVTEWIARRAPLLVELRIAGVRALDASGLPAVLDAALDLAGHAAKHDPPAEAFARDRILEARRELCMCLPEVSAADGPSLHRLRIRFKRLRYTCEMLGGAMRAAESDITLPDADSYLATAKHAAAFQKELGAVHDADVALVTTHAASDVDEATRGAVLAALTQARERLAKRAIDHLAAELRHVVLPHAAL